MKRTRHTYIALLLALMLAFTGQSMAVARGMPDATGQIVLCTGSGPMVVSVDENGQPTGPAHICPDFAASLFAALGHTPPIVLHDATILAPHWPDRALETFSQTRHASRARAPPV